MGLVAVVLDELLRERRPRGTAAAAICIVLASWEDFLGGATGIQEASELTGLFIHDSGLPAGPEPRLLTDSPRFALVIDSNCTPPWSKATQSLSPS